MLKQCIFHVAIAKYEAWNATNANLTRKQAILKSFILWVVLLNNVKLYSYIYSGLVDSIFIDTIIRACKREFNTNTMYFAIFIRDIVVTQLFQCILIDSFAIRKFFKEEFNTNLKIQTEEILFDTIRLRFALRSILASNQTIR